MITAVSLHLILEYLYVYYDLQCDWLVGGAKSS